MTIDVGYAHLALPDGTELDFVDVPGHDRLVGNMLVGAGEIDAALVVVAADDGPRAQTLEHLALLDALAIRHGVAVVTKTDLAGPERTAEVVAAVERLLGGTSLSAAPVLAASAIDGTGIDALREALAALRDRILADPRAELAGRGLAPADRSGLRGQGSWHGRDRVAARTAGRAPERRSGSCRATGPSASARSRSTGPRSSAPDPAASP